MECPCGGGRVGRHDRIRDLMAKLHQEATGSVAVTEQHVPEWDRPNPRTGEIERAILDVAGQAVESPTRVYLDVTVVGEESEDLCRLHARAKRDGAAAQAAERGKMTRYSKAGPALVPCALEQGGRSGEALVALLRSYARAADALAPAAELSRLRHRVSTALQMGNAEMMLSAGRRRITP